MRWMLLTSIIHGRSIVLKPCSNSAGRHVNDVVTVREVASRLALRLTQHVPVFLIENVRRRVVVDVHVAGIKNLKHLAAGRGQENVG